MSDEFNLVNDLAESRAQVYGAYADFFSGNGSSGFAGNGPLSDGCRGPA